MELRDEFDTTQDFIRFVERQAPSFVSVDHRKIHLCADEGLEVESQRSEEAQRQWALASPPQAVRPLLDKITEIHFWATNALKSATPGLLIHMNETQGEMRAEIAEQVCCQLGSIEEHLKPVLELRGEALKVLRK